MKIEFRLDVVIEWDDSTSIEQYGQQKTDLFNAMLKVDLEKIWIEEKRAFQARLGNKIKNFINQNKQ